jgi:hypothetical protein
VRRQEGEAVVRREVWHGEPKVGWAGIVVEDTPELLAIYMPEGSPFGFAADFFGAPHPWSHRDRWEGHGVLQLQRPGEMHAVWVFWHGPEREFRGWYVNLQEPFRRTRLGLDTQDLELRIRAGRCRRCPRIGMPPGEEPRLAVQEAPPRAASQAFSARIRAAACVSRFWRRGEPASSASSVA